MATNSLAGQVRRLVPTTRPDAAEALSVLRTFGGLISWASPAISWRTFGLGPIGGADGVGASATLATRLFGVRDLLLGLAVRNPNPDLRRAALQIGVAADSADLAATLLAIRAGAPKATLLGVGAGAAFFVALGVSALRTDQRPRSV